PLLPKRGGMARFGSGGGWPLSRQCRLRSVQRIAVTPEGREPAAQIAKRFDLYSPPPAVSRSATTLRSEIDAGLRDLQCEILSLSIYVGGFKITKDRLEAIGQLVVLRVGSNCDLQQLASPFERRLC